MNSLFRLIQCTILLAVAVVMASHLWARDAAAAGIGGCPPFPANNIWNTAIDTVPLDAKTDAYISSEGGAGANLHPDFGTKYNGAPNGIPFVVVPSDQALVPIEFTDYGDESDPGPYPVPANAPIEGGKNGTGDRHVLVIQRETCALYEMFAAYPQKDGSWKAASGAIFHLKKNGPLRHAGWTSADAAGLPIFPGLVRYAELQKALAGDGVIHHALRFTVPNTRQAYIWPARHWASNSNDPDFPPMGQRFRLKASTNIDVYPGTHTPVSASNQVILRTLKEYGMFVADNGSSFYLSGAPDSRWSDDDLHNLGYYNAADFEAVDESGLMLDANSGKARQP